MNATGAGLSLLCPCACRQTSEASPRLVQRSLSCSAVRARLLRPALQLLGTGDVGVTRVQWEQLLLLAALAGAGGAVSGDP